MKLVAGLTGVDGEAIWQWGLLETLANGLLYLDVGSAQDAAPFLAVAEAWAASEALDTMPASSRSST